MASTLVVAGNVAESAGEVEESMSLTCEALAIYRRAVETWPGDSMLFHDLAVAAGRAGLRDEAARAEQAAIALDPKNGAAHNGLGLLLIEQDRRGEAAQAFERASAADPSSAEYLANLGNARRPLGDRTGAEAAYRAAIAADPATADGLNGLGVLLVESGRAAEAVAMREGDRGGVVRRVAVRSLARDRGPGGGGVGASGEDPRG